MVVQAREGNFRPSDAYLSALCYPALTDDLTEARGYSFAISGVLGLQGRVIVPQLNAR